MELFFILAITLGGLCFVGYPLFTEVARWRDAPGREPSRQEDLQARKDNAISAIKELEFDYRTGKLTADDYASLRARYEAEAVETMKGLDGLERGGKTLKTNQGKEGALICSACGEEVSPGGRFCSNCGTRFDGAQPSG